MKRPIGAAAAALLSVAILAALLAGCYPKARLYELGDDGALVFLVNPPDADVVLDGVVQGQASDFTEDRYLKVPPGTHRLELRREGYETYAREIYVSRSLKRIEATLVVTPSEPAAATPPPPRSW
jgi:hypothetical protein